MAKKRLNRIQKIEKIIAENLDGLSLWSVWCNHYKDKKQYLEWKDKDLKHFAKYLAKGL